VFLTVGELALHVAYLDGWPARQWIWPCTAALTGNIGHIPGRPRRPADRCDQPHDRI
jgi:hypothetical protein